MTELWGLKDKLNEFHYEVFFDGVSKAYCRGWDAKQAALRLLYGTSLMLPPQVLVVSIKRAS